MQKTVRNSRECLPGGPRGLHCERCASSLSLQGVSIIVLDSVYL